MVYETRRLRSKTPVARSMSFGRVVVPFQAPVRSDFMEEILRAERFQVTAYVP